MAVDSIIFLIFVKSVYSLLGIFVLFAACLLLEKNWCAVVLHVTSLCNFLICGVVCYFAGAVV